MSNAKQAAEQIKNLAGKFRGILEVANALEKIGDLEQSAIENQNLKAKAISEYQEAKKQLENIHHRIQEAGKAAAEILDLAQAKKRLGASLDANLDGEAEIGKEDVSALAGCMKDIRLMHMKRGVGSGMAAGHGKNPGIPGKTMPPDETDYEPYLLTADPVNSTSVAFRYTTTNTPTSGVVKIRAYWEPITASGNLVEV